MIISREELQFPFRDIQFNLKSAQERKFLGWVFNQFLYGEVTGIQCGHWLYRAPSLAAASFLARQAEEELSHVRRILRILSILNEKPEKAQWAIRFMATGMMGGTWGEHVAIEMALGEGLVLGVFYALEDTIPDPEIQRILKSATVEEERHIEFGERETLKWLHAYPDSRGLLKTLAVIQIWALQGLKNTVLKKISDQLGADHPVSLNFGEFYDHIVRCFELRVQRLGISEYSLLTLSSFEKVKMIGALPFRRIRDRFKFKTPLLTESYLQDPALVAELTRYPLSSIKSE